MMFKLFSQILCKIMNLKKNISLRNYTSFGINQKVKNFYSIQNEDDVIKTIKLIPSSEPKVILGGGSNILFTKDFEGSVLYNNILGRNITKETKDSIFIKFGAGENWDNIVEYCVNNEWYGLENLSLIPGSVGAAPIQNIGAYGTEIKNFIHEVNGINLLNGKSKKFNNKSCNFSYRNSIFKSKLKNVFFITYITIKLSKTKKLNMTYKEVKEFFENKDLKKITLKQIRNTIIKIRKSKLPNPKILGNAGSFFKNPMIKIQKFNNLKKKYPNIPSYGSSNNKKIPAAWLIEKCGWKGYKENKVGVYNKHALILVNYGCKSGKEIFKLSEKIKKSVTEKFNIILQREVNVY